ISRTSCRVSRGARGSAHWVESGLNSQVTYSVWWASIKLSRYSLITSSDQSVSCRQSQQSSSLPIHLTISVLPHLSHIDILFLSLYTVSTFFSLPPFPAHPGRRFFYFSSLGSSFPHSFTRWNWFA